MLLSEDFENGLGPFRQVGGQAGLNWFRGTQAGNGARWLGQQAAFASGSATAYAPVPNVNDATHLYCDVTFPAGTSTFFLRLDMRTEGRFTIFQAPTTFLPLGGVEPLQLPQVYSVTGTPNPAGPAVFTSLQIRLSPALAGTTQRFVFTWVNRAVLRELPAAFDNVQFIAGALPPLAGTYAIDRQQPSSARSFSSFTEAIWALNEGGTAGPTTFEATPGQRFVEAPPWLRGTNSHAVVFRRGAGAGANPAIQSENIGIALSGASNFTFDGIDIVPGTTGPVVGYQLSNRDNVAGCRNVTIRNCAIRLGNSSEFTRGIYQQSTLYANLGQGDTARVNGHIRYENITIDHVNEGIRLKSDYQNMPDYDVEISHVTIGSGAARSIGQTTRIEGTNGIYANRLNGLRVHDSVIRGLVGSNDQLCGIYLSDVVGPQPTVIARNRLDNLEYLLPNVTASFTGIYGIRIYQTAGAGTNYLAPPADVQVFNNQVQNLYYNAAPTYPFRVEGSVQGLYFMVTNAPTNQYLVANNTVALSNVATPGVGLTNLILGCAQPSHGPVEAVNNVLVATTPTSGPRSALLVHVDVPRNQGAATATNLRLDHNDYVLNSVPQGDVGHVHVEGTSTATPFVGQTLADWKALTQQEKHSRDLDPQFAPGSDLRPTNPALARAGTLVKLVATDLAGQPRATPPDVGVLEFSPPLVASPTTVVQAWPVPFADYLELALPASLTGELQAELVDAMGRIALRQTLPDGTGAHQLTGLAHLAPGSYVLCLRSAKGEVVRLHVAR
ncbi:hypothetical protein [Hymenobacter properus]|uniref:T9SS type A sorting domain-containing protein n=1 Tax=Hymenobacter properus TaxID=2791026 RepID=A0A931FL97_9BACT|nr:hypothetical protein [Hymenobacter properus]MBF9140489.1 hypothetical protein [Hymenobacter properus]MBR7719296.1 hypothetical protein [Microvirga sp. SRT04]